MKSKLITINIKIKLINKCAIFGIVIAHIKVSNALDLYDMQDMQSQESVIYEGTR